MYFLYAPFYNGEEIVLFKSFRNSQGRNKGNFFVEI